MIVRMLVPTARARPDKMQGRPEALQDRPEKMWTNLRLEICFTFSNNIS